MLLATTRKGEVKVVRWSMHINASQSVRTLEPQCLSEGRIGRSPRPSLLTSLETATKLIIFLQEGRQSSASALQN
ncbi:hypothetical protein E2C01_000263 [Portunus trituberculatus]|uniref:Uncharacterized protein n=1 Tax=Portunus trituberculatus TaxID=210409 RepID=A0A5B7CEP3_PORTR|nr:hypothetical protein [Portunus trituberculatus]